MFNVKIANFVPIKIYKNFTKELFFAVDVLGIKETKIKKDLKCHLI